MLFIVIDVLGGIPIFIGLLQGMSKEEVRKTINLATITSFFILLFFAVIGRWILNLFGISLNEFRIAGGILLLIIALDEIFGFLSEKTYIKRDIGVVPIACPLLTGPGAITVILITLYKLNFPINYLVVILSAVIVTFVNWIILLRLDNISKILGRKGVLILNKLMGIMLAAISVNFIIGGIMKIITLYLH